MYIRVCAYTYVCVYVCENIRLFVFAYNQMLFTLIEFIYIYVHMCVYNIVFQPHEYLANKNIHTYIHTHRSENLIFSIILLIIRNTKTFI